MHVDALVWYRCVGTHLSMLVDTRDQRQCLPGLFSSYFTEAGSLMWAQISSVQLILASQHCPQIPDLHLPCTGDIDTAAPTQDLYGCWESELCSLHLTGKRFLTEKHAFLWWLLEEVSQILCCPSDLDLALPWLRYTGHAHDVQNMNSQSVGCRFLRSTGDRW